MCTRFFEREAHLIAFASFSHDSCKDERDLDKDNGFQRVSHFESRRSGFLTTRPSLLHNLGRCLLRGISIYVVKATKSAVRRYYTRHKQLAGRCRSFLRC